MTRATSLRSSLPFLALTSFLAAACGGETRSATRGPDAPGGHAFGPWAAPGHPAPEPAAAPPSAERAARSSPAASGAKSAEAAADSAMRPMPAPEERPGLGTEWGETRESRVSSAPFERQSYDTPLAATSIYYNDESGARAALGSSYWTTRRDGISTARGAVTIRLVDDSGAPLPTLAAGERNFVVGHDGARYAIRIENNSGVRFEAVATVDGLDVIDGRPGSLEKRGYLVAPWSTVEIDGFRRSEAEVAAFRFGRVKDSYAARRGDDRNVGVIGVAIFEERGARWPWTEGELRRRDDADPFPGRFAPAP